MFLPLLQSRHDFSSFIEVCNGFVFKVVLEKQHSLEKNMVVWLNFVIII